MRKKNHKSNGTRMSVLGAAAGILAGGSGLASGQAAGGAAAPVPPPAVPAWKKSASLGFTLTQGNSDTLLFTGRVDGSKKWENNEMSLGADATYGEVDDRKNAESVHGFAQYNRLFTDRFFGYLRFDALHDAIADVEYRLSLSPGVGYYFIKSERTQLSGEVGPGFVYEKQGDDTTGYMTLRIAERFEHKLNDKTRIWQSFEYLPQVDDFENYILNFEVGIESLLTEKLSMKTYLQDTYDNVPAPGRKRNDLKLVAALGYAF